MVRRGTLQNTVKTPQKLYICPFRVTDYKITSETAAQRFQEEKWICRLKALGRQGLNTEIGDYAKETHNFH